MLDYYETCKHFNFFLQTFFERADQKRLQEYQAIGQDILKQLSPSNQKALRENMTALEQSWKVNIYIYIFSYFFNLPLMETGYFGTV